MKSEDEGVNSSAKGRRPNPLLSYATHPPWKLIIIINASRLDNRAGREAKALSHFRAINPVPGRASKTLKSAETRHHTLTSAIQNIIAYYAYYTQCPKSSLKTSIIKWINEIFAHTLKICIRHFKPNKKSYFKNSRKIHINIQSEGSTYTNWL